MPIVACPACGAVVELNSLSRTADEFCPTPGCDYPLFWAKGTAAEVVVDRPADEAVRRQPGTGGRHVVSPEPCPVCREPNKPTAVFCQRCGAEMHPAPAPPEPPPPPEPEPAPPPRLPLYRNPSPWSDWRVIAVLVVLLVTLMMTGSLVLLSRS